MSSERAREIAEGLRRITEAACFTSEDWEAVMAALRGCDTAPLARPDPAAGRTVTCPDIDRIRGRLLSGDYRTADALTLLREVEAQRTEIQRLGDELDEAATPAEYEELSERADRQQRTVEGLVATIARLRERIERLSVSLSSLSLEHASPASACERFRDSGAKTPTPVTLHVDGIPFHVKDSRDSAEVEDAIKRIAERFTCASETPRGCDQKGPGHVDGLFRRVILEMAARYEAEACRLRDEVPGEKP